MITLQTLLVYRHKFTSIKFHNKTTQSDNPPLIYNVLKITANKVKLIHYELNGKGSLKSTRG